MKKCFIICPISDEGTETRKRSDDLFEFIVQPVCTDLNYEAIRVDKINNNDRIDNTILTYLQESELVIADLTEYNPNAFYEIGYRSAIGKPIIHMITQDVKIPFDIASIRTLTYSTTDIRKANEVKISLKETILTVEKQVNQQEQILGNSSNINIEDNDKKLLSHIFNSLSDLKLSIDGLYKAIDNNNEKTLKTIMSTSINEVKNSQPKTLEETFLPQFLTMMINDPQKADGLLTLMDKFPGTPKSK